MRKLALLLSLLALGALGLTACGGGDDDEVTAASETETTGDGNPYDELAADPADNKPCGISERRRLTVVEGDFSCREARRLMHNVAYNSLPYQWRCSGEAATGGYEVCTDLPGASSRIVILARFASEAAAVEADPENKNRPCGDFQPFPGGYIALRVAVVEGNIPCRVALRVLKDVYRHSIRWIEDEEALGRSIRGSWTCHGPEGDIKCKRPHQGAPSGGKIRGLCVRGLNGLGCLRTY